MMRYLSITTLLLVIGGLILHYQLQIPFVSNWLGKLPGDLFIKRDEVIYYFPIASAAVMGFVVFLILELFESKPKK